MIDIPSCTTIAQMSEQELIAAFAKLSNVLNGTEITVDEQAYILLTLQHISEALRLRKAARCQPMMNR